VPLSSQVAGEIVRIHPNFEDGAFVEKGEILVELEPADFEAAVVAAEAEEVRASVALAQEEIRAEQAQLNWEKLGKQGDPSDLVKRLPQLREAKTNLNAATWFWTPFWRNEAFSEPKAE
jgi:multidrug resistance efflux pump